MFCLCASTHMCTQATAKVGTTTHECDMLRDDNHKLREEVRARTHTCVHREALARICKHACVCATVRLCVMGVCTRQKVRLMDR